MRCHGVKEALLNEAKYDMKNYVDWGWSYSPRQKFVRLYVCSTVQLDLISI